MKKAKGDQGPRHRPQLALARAHLLEDGLMARQLHSNEDPSVRLLKVSERVRRVLGELLAPPAGPRQ